MTYGMGVFWKDVKHATMVVDPPWKDDNIYQVWKNDQDGERGEFHYDFTTLPNDWTDCFDGVVLDPPYMGVGGIKTLHEGFDKRYKNRQRASDLRAGISAVRRLYALGICEAWRVLKRSGILIVKTMDQVESGQQNFLSHDIMELCRILGFKVEDEFIYVTAKIPLLRHERQLHARRNHSSWIVARRRP